MAIVGPPKPGAEKAEGAAGVFELSPATLRAAVEREQQIREVLKEHLQRNMEEGRHLYWLSKKDKEANKKPSLTKEGAFNLAGLFRSRPVPREPLAEYHADGHFTVITRVDLVSWQTGEPIATGDGLATTRESKYAYRWAWPSDVPEHEREGLRTRTVRARGNDVTQYAVPNRDLADQFNTVLKMSFKRAAVAAALTLPVASELLTQDLEDLAPPADDDAAADDGDGAGAGAGAPGGPPTLEAVMEAAKAAGKTPAWVKALSAGTFRKAPEDLGGPELARLLEEVRKHGGNGNGGKKADVRTGGEVKPAGAVQAEAVRKPEEEPRGEAKPTAAQEAPWDPAKDTPEQAEARVATMARIHNAAEAAKMGAEEWRGIAKTIYGHQPEEMPVDMLALLAGRLERIARGEGLGGPMGAPPAVSGGEVDTLNKFMVSARGETLVIMRQPVPPLSRDDALILAAYLVAVAAVIPPYGDDVDERFAAVLKAVRRT